LGYVNVDICPPADQIVDLRENWPWPDCSVDEIIADNVIEHLPDKIHTMNEVWRVLRLGGTIVVTVPTTDGSGAFQDPTHVSFWHRRSFLYFEAGCYYRNRLAQAYGIRAAFSVAQESIENTPDGPQLTILLVAKK
jgi:SAM-dependent methyltransferase